MKFEFDVFEIDPTCFELRYAGAPVRIPRLVFDVMIYLIQHRDRPVTKKELLDRVWMGRTVTEASLTQVITAARRAVGDSPKTQRVIRTVNGRGYWWVATTGVCSASQGPPVSEAALVGREHELGRLEVLWERAVHRSGGLALVVGDPGQGKTRLVESFADRVRGAGGAVVWSFAQESRPTSPMSIWSQVVSGLEAGALIPRHHAAMQAVVGGVESNDPHTDDPAEARSALGIAKSRLIESIISALSCSGRGILVVLEDLHRADTTSLLTLLMVAPRLSMTRVMILGTLRPPVFATEEPTRQALLALSSKSSAALIPLQPLAKAHVEEMVRSAGGAPSTTSLIWDRSRGNPFLANLLIQLTRLDSRSSFVDREDIPNALASAITARCEELPTGILVILRVASVLGEVFQANVAATLAGEQPEVVSLLLHQAEQAGLLRSMGAGVYRFCHSIVRDALYAQLRADRRMELHGLAARVLEGVRDPGSLDHLAELAHHYANSDPAQGAQRAVSLLRLCGDKARLAPDDAAAFFSRALEIGRKSRALEEDVEIDIMRRLGESLVLAGRRKEGRSVLVEAGQRARARGDFETVGRAALAVAPGLLSIETGGIDVALVDLLECAVAAEDQGLSLRTELIGRLALALYWAGEDDRRRSLLVDLEAKSEDLTEGDGFLRASLYWLAAGWSPTSHEDRRQRLRALASGGGDRGRGLGPVLRVFTATTMLESGDWAGARRQVAHLEAEVLETRDPHAAWYPGMYRAMFALADGRVSEAECLVGEYARVARVLDDQNVEHCLAAQLGESSWLRGRADLAIAGTESLINRFPGMPEWRCVLAFFLSVAGRTQEAAARVSEVSRHELSALAPNMNFVLAACALAEAAVRVGLASEAPRIRAALLPYAGMNAIAGFGVVSWGAVSRYIGQLETLSGAWHEAEVSLRAGLEHDKGSGCALLVARSELAIAEMYCRRGRSGDDAESKHWAESALERVKGRCLAQIEADAARIKFGPEQIVA